MKKAEVASGAAGKGLLKVIFTNPPVLISLLVIITGFVIYIGMSAQYQMSQIMNQYSSLDAKPENSKEGFDKKLFYVTVDENGNTVVHVGFESEEQEIAAQQAAEEAGVADASLSVAGSNGAWSGTSVAMNAIDFYAPATFDKGQATSIQVNGVTLYNSIPWDDDGNFYQLDLDAMSDYLEVNIGKPLSLSSSVHKDNNNSSTPIVKNGVNCMGIAWLPIFSFCSMNEDGSYTPAWGGTLASTGYGVAILEKDGNTYYIPICSGGDNKGHVWPGGMVQTYVQNSARVSNGTVTFGGNTECDWGSVNMANLSISLDEFREGWKTQVKYQGAVVGNYHPSLTIETHNNFKSALSGFTIKGFVIHK